MGEERKKEASRELAEEKTRPLIKSEQDPKDTLLPVEKSGERTEPSIRNVQSGRKKLGILAVIVVVLAALAVGLGIYNKPENRLARQLDLGERYLEEQNYAEAVLAFEKAIQIDERCMAAYVNGIAAYRHLDEPEKLMTFYDKAVEAARSLEGEELSMDMDAVVSIYLAAEDVYTDREALIALWEEGYEKSGQDGRVRNGLVRVYLTRAEERASNGAYEEGLQDYDRLLELDGQNETVLESLTGSLKSYLDFLLEEENFERVRELAEKYASALRDFDFAFYLDETDHLGDKINRMENVRDEMQKADIENLLDCINEYRNEAGLSLLVWNEDLALKAKEHLIDPDNTPFIKHALQILGPDLAAEVAKSLADYDKDYEENYGRNVYIYNREYRSVGGAVIINENGYCNWLVCFK